MKEKLGLLGPGPGWKLSDVGGADLLCPCAGAGHAFATTKMFFLSLNGYYCISNRIIVILSKYQLNQFESSKLELALFLLQNNLLHGEKKTNKLF